jgi:hypothetical protein
LREFVPTHLPPKMKILHPYLILRDRELTDHVAVLSGG